jgi:hypothetical protein
MNKTPTAKETTMPTMIDQLKEKMWSYSTEMLMEIANECHAINNDDHRVVKYAAFEVIEWRHPQVIPIMVAWCDDLNKTETYVEMLAMALKQINFSKAGA